jgi:hypothetical protein
MGGEGSMASAILSLKQNRALLKKEKSRILSSCYMRIPVRPNWNLSRLLLKNWKSLKQKLEKMPRVE